MKKSTKFNAAQKFLCVQYDFFIILYIILNATALSDYGICYVLCSICSYVHVLIICMHTFTNR